MKKTDVTHKLPDAIKDRVDNIAANSVMPASKIVGSIFFTGDHLVRVEELLVCASTHFIYKNINRFFVCYGSKRNQNIKRLSIRAVSKRFGKCSIDFIEQNNST